MHAFVARRPIIGCNAVLLIFTFNRQMAPLTDTLPFASLNRSLCAVHTADRLVSPPSR